MRRILLLIFFLSWFHCVGVAQTCDSIAKIVVVSGHHGYIPNSEHPYIGESDQTCECKGCFCLSINVRGVSAACFYKSLTIIGSQKVKIGKVWVDHKESEEVSVIQKCFYTVVHFKFIPKNKKRALRRLARDKSLGYDFFIIDKHTREVYFKWRL